MILDSGHHSAEFPRTAWAPPRLARGSGSTEATPRRPAQRQITLVNDASARRTTSASTTVTPPSGAAEDAGVAIPDRSAEIEVVFQKFYSDHDAATTKCSTLRHPAGGLFTGAEERKSAKQRARYGGVTGAAFDPCYHQPFDSVTPLPTAPTPSATGVLTFAYDTSTVNDAPRAPGKSQAA